MTNVWILGAGKFGIRAGTELKRIYPHADILLIDHEPSACRMAQLQGLRAKQCDAIDFLSKMLVHSDTTELIVPVIPVHVAFKWIENRLLNRFQIVKRPVPAQLVAELPNPVIGQHHTVYTSIADFQCPEDCPEPDWGCTVTGKPRPCSVQAVLQQYNGLGMQVVAIDSYHFAPGVGGYRPQVLFDALERIERSQTPVILSTACPCHGVVDAFKLEASNAGADTTQSEM